MPSQVSGSAIYFVVEELRPYEKRYYTIKQEEHKAPSRCCDSASLTRLDNRMCFSNDRISILLPATQKLAGHAKKYPGPIIAARRNDGRWLGQGWIESSLPLRSIRTKLVESGPLWATVGMVFSFDGGFIYIVKLRLETRSDFFEIEEESKLPLRLWPAPRPYREIGSLNPSFWRQSLDSLGRPCLRPCPASNFFLDLRAGGGCDRIITHSTASWELMDLPLHSPILRTYTAMRPCLPFIDGAWMGFYSTRHSQMLGLVSVKIHDWSGPDHFLHPAHRTPGANSEVILVDSKVHGSYLRFPIENVRRLWIMALVPRYLEKGKLKKMSPRTMPVRFEPDPAMPLWNLHVRRSAFPLEKAKGWVTEWQNAGHKHPCLFAGPEELDGISEKVKRVPELWANYKKTRKFHPADRYLVEREPASLSEVEAATHAKEIVERILQRGYAGPDYGIALSRPLRRYAIACDFLWDCFSDNEKKEVRRVCSLAVYILTDGDWWQYAYREGETTYLPNFNSDVFTCAGLIGIFLRDHPCSEAWINYLVKHLETELKYHVREDGCGEENVGCYYPHTVSALYLPAMWALRRCGIRDFSTDHRILASARFFLNTLEPPNPRDKGLRQLPPIGHHPHMRKTLSWAPWMAAFLKKKDPELAGNLMWAWRATGAFVHRNHDHSGPAAEPLTLHYVLHDPSIPEIRPTLKSCFLPHVGAILRSQEEQGKSSYVFFKAGRVHSHHDEDEGSFHYYARGVPMALDGLSLQNGSPRHHHNALTFAVPGQPTMSIKHFFSSPIADYARGQVTPRGYCSDTTYVDDAHRNSWERQIILVKAKRPGAVEYLILKDVAGGPDACQWNLDVLSQRPSVKKPGHVWFPGHKQKGFGMGLDVIVLEPFRASTVIERGTVCKDLNPLRTRTARSLATAAGGPTMRLLYNVVEHWLLHIPGPPGSTFVVLLFPRRRREEPPDVRYFARQETIEILHGDGRDLVFLNPNPRIEIALDGLLFRGRTGIARQGRDGKRLLEVLEGEYLLPSDYPDKSMAVL